MVSWPVEAIPDDDELYMRVHRQWLRQGRVVPGFFRNLPNDATGGMSSDWSRYSTPEETRRRARTPSDNAVVGLSVREVRATPEQRVEHTPLPENRAHAEVFGPKDPEIQLLLSRAANLVLAPRAG